MEVIYGLIPGMLLLGLLAVGLMFWAARSGQFDDLDGDAQRILMDEDLDESRANKGPASHSSVQPPAIPGLVAQVLPDAERVAQTACTRILKHADAAIAERGVFRLVLAGGSTPLRAYALLAKQQADWSRWHLYHGDERCLPVNDTERNSHAVRQAWLSQVPIPVEQIHDIQAERGAEAAADDYEALITEALPFDLVLLGLGEDGHTASLFPGQSIPESSLVMAVHGAPKPPPDRVSLTPAALTQTRDLLFLVTGAGKREALSRWQAGEEIPAAVVAAGLVATGGAGQLLLDEAAAGS